MRKGLIDWLETENPDVFLVQETKAQPDQIDTEPFEALGYQCFAHSAEKKGYSGVAIFSKVKPDKVVMGCGIEKFDREGRVIRADFGDISVLNTYFPSGSSGEERQKFKMEFLTDYALFVKGLLKERPKLIVSGDYNICHKAIDIHNPVSNKNSSGFLPEERQWVTDFIDLGFVDSFRKFNSEGDNYSWWTYRAGARGKNKGWRIDYHMVSKDLNERLSNAGILPEAMHSDHCPILAEIN